MKFLGPLFWAAVAAFGNGIFAYSQKRLAGVDNTLMVAGVCGAVAVLFTWVVTPLFGTTRYGSFIGANSRWLLFGGFGLFLTYIGFNLLYTRYGTSYYVLYAVLAIITTTLFVGIILFRESFNGYQWTAFMLALAAVVLFSIGQQQKVAKVSAVVVNQGSRSL